MKHEKDIVKFISEYLEAHDILFVRPHPVRPVGFQGKITFARIAHSQKGAPDFIIFHNGRATAFECKSDNGKLSAEQEDWRDKFMDSHAGKYIVTREKEDFLMGL